MRSPIQQYLDDEGDSRLPRRAAEQSSLPSSNINAHGRYAGVYAPTTGTSMLLSGNSSLPALSTASSVSGPSSVDSSVGSRALGDGRLLEFDPFGALQIAPLRHRPTYECPFHFLYCLLTFSSFSEWLAHSLTHFNRHDPPTTNRCSFCEKTFPASNGMQSWSDTMHHVALHHQLGHKLAHSRPAFDLHNYLYCKKVIDSAQYKELMGHKSRPRPEDAYLTPPTSPTQRRPAPSAGAYTITNQGGDRRRPRT